MIGSRRLRESTSRSASDPDSSIGTGSFEDESRASSMRFAGHGCVQNVSLPRPSSAHPFAARLLVTHAR
jgi:hypothetical protein